MVKSNNIQIYLRVRPSKRASRGMIVDEEAGTINCFVEKKREGELANN
jgi:hypothetical protein